MACLLYTSVQLSDLHLKEFGENNQELVERVKILEPDIIAITGDMNMEQNDDYHVVLDLCRQLVEITDVYYVMGNHELVDYAHRRTRIREDIEKTGVHMLFNHAEMIQVNTNDIYIGGLINEPYNYVEYGGKRFMDEYVRSEAFKLLLDVYKRQMDSCYGGFSEDTVPVFHLNDHDGPDNRNRADIHGDMAGAVPGNLLCHKGDHQCCMSSS